jgi:quercetin dioxygenase-like cupin family protein
MFNTKAYSAASATSALAATTIPRCDPTDRNNDSDRPALPGRREVLKAGAGMAVAPLVLGVASAAQPTSNRPRKAGMAATKHNSKEQHMDIQRLGTKASVKGPADWFTGTTRIDPMFDAKDPSRVSGASVTFEPGARTAWHTHPVGQHLIITSGVGWVQQEGGPIQEVRPGDVVWFPPGVKHWHGATAKTAMSHLAIQEVQDGSPVKWMEKVSGDPYRK